MQLGINLHVLLLVYHVIVVLQNRRNGLLILRKL